MGLLSMFTGGVVDTVGDVAETWLNKDATLADKKILMMKALDPNGKMRLEISRTVKDMYRMYIYLVLVLVLAQAFHVGNPDSVAEAIESLIDLFLPITGMFTAIISASFGTNVSNNWKDTKATSK